MFKSPPYHHKSINFFYSIPFHLILAHQDSKNDEKSDWILCVCNLWYQLNLSKVDSFIILIACLYKQKKTCTFILATVENHRKFDINQTYKSFLNMNTQTHNMNKRQLSIEINHSNRTRADKKRERVKTHTHTQFTKLIAVNLHKITQCAKIEPECWWMQWTEIKIIASKALWLNYPQLIYPIYLAFDALFSRLYFRSSDKLMKQISLFVSIYQLICAVLLLLVMVVAICSELVIPISHSTVINLVTIK